MATANQLTLDEAYEAAFLWLDAFGDLPTSITEPAADVIEMRGEQVLARLRWSRSPVSQGAVLALLRAADEPTQLILFAPSGFTAGARALADTQKVALFRLDTDGSAVAVNTFAEVLQPDEIPAPFATPQEPDLLSPRTPLPTPVESEEAVPPEPAEPAPSPMAPAVPRAAAAGAPPPVPAQSPVTATPTGDWITCPACGLSHHRDSNFCMRCGADLHNVGLRPATPARPAAVPVPPPGPNAPTLRCRTCGSHDIELVHPGSPGFT